MRIRYILLALCLFLTGCTPQLRQETTVPDEFDQAPSEVVYNPPTQSELLFYAVRPDTFNPLLTTFMANRNVLSLIYEPLVGVSQDFSLSFKLAENFYISDGGQKLTLLLRQNVRWQDGGIFSAHDVDYTIHEIIKSGDACPYAEALKNIKTTNIVNSYTYEITLNTPDSGFIYLLTFPVIKSGVSDIVKNKDSFTPIGTGMYAFGEHDALKSFQLTANPSWWGGAASILTVTVNLLPDATYSYNGFKMHSMNAVIMSSDQSGKYSAGDNIQSVLTNTNIYSYISVSQSNPLLRSPVLRKIIKEIVSTPKITQDLIPDFSTLCASPVNPASQYYQAPPTGTQDIKELLNKEGYIQNNSGIRTKTIDNKTHRLEFSLLINADNPMRVITGEYIANTLSLYGIKIDLIRAKEQEYQTHARSGHYDLVLCETDIRPNNNFSFLLATDGELNLGKFSSPEMDDLLRQISTAGDLAARAELLIKFQQLFYDTMPQIPLYFQNKKILYDSATLANVSVGCIGSEYSSVNTWTIISGKETEQKNAQ